MHVTGSGYVGDFDFGNRVMVGFSCHDNYGRACPLVGGQAVVLIGGSTADSPAGVTISEPDPELPGVHCVTVDTAQDTTEGRDYYPDGTDFRVILSAGTVDGHAAKGTLVGQFSIANRS